MSDAVARALGMLEAGRWDVAKALDAIKTPPKKIKVKSAGWLRVKVVEDGQKKVSLRLPLGVVSVLSAALNPLVKWGARYAAKKHAGDKMPDLSRLNLRLLLKTLKKYGPMTVVDIRDGETEILIQTT